MRYIYMDEAGTSTREPVKVVVAVIVHADNQWRPAQRMIEKVIAEEVPEKYRANFVSHAKDIMGKAYGDGWDIKDRFKFLRRLAMVPRDVGLAMAWAAVRRDSDVHTKLGLSSSEYTVNELQHAFAFGACLAHADRFIHEQAPTEIATVVAEEVGEKEELVRRAVSILKAAPMEMDDTKHVILSPNRYSWRQFVSLKVEHTVDEVQFVAKGDAVMLQLADVIAYGLRRFLEGLRYGAEWYTAITGKPVVGEVRIRHPFEGGLHYNPEKEAQP